MDNALMNKILFAQTKSGREIDVSVVGISMNPTF